MENKKVLSKKVIDYIIESEAKRCANAMPPLEYEEAKNNVKKQLDSQVEYTKFQDQLLKQYTNVKEHMEQEFYEEYLDNNK